MSTVISVENISKSYRLGMIGGGTLREDFSRWWAKVSQRPDPTLKIGLEHHARHVGQEFWALQDVCFEVQDGEILGIIGSNGAGKSTLLKILSRVTGPTSGNVKIKGRIASLLEVGTGFHPELTGRENIFLNGTILGMTKAEIRSKFDGIVAFSEIEEFIDTPVKRYSSGMYVRLAFAVAAHLEPEILVLDEVLAVGDSQFQKKCLGKMDDVSRQGRTVLFVSHNLAAVQKLCSKGALLDGGRLVGFGPIDAIIEAYRGNLETTELTWSVKEDVIHKSAYIERMSLQSAQGSTGSGLRTTDTLQLCIRLKCQTPIPGAQVAIRFVSEDGIAILTSTSTDETCEAHFIDKGTHYIKVTIPPNFLAPVYISTICAILRPGGEVIDAVEDGLSFKLDDGLNHASVLGDHRRGVVTPIFHWDWEARV